jgi:hypothetical protein
MQIVRRKAGLARTPVMTQTPARVLVQAAATSAVIPVSEVIVPSAMVAPVSVLILRFWPAAFTRRRRFGTGLKSNPQGAPPGRRWRRGRG